MGDARNGVVEYAFPMGSRSKLLFIQIRDNSINQRFQFYGWAVEAEAEAIRRT